MTLLKQAPLIVTPEAIIIVSPQLEDITSFLGREAVLYYVNNPYLGEQISFTFLRDNDAPFMVGALVTHALLRVQADLSGIRIPRVPKAGLKVFLAEAKNEIILGDLDIDSLNNKRLSRMRNEGNDVLAEYLSTLSFDQDYSPTLKLGACNTYETVMSALEDKRVPSVFKRE